MKRSIHHPCFCLSPFSSLAKGLCFVLLFSLFPRLSVHLSSDGTGVPTDQKVKIAVSNYGNPFIRCEVEPQEGQYTFWVDGKECRTFRPGERYTIAREGSLVVVRNRKGVVLCKGKNVVAKPLNESLLLSFVGHSDSKSSCKRLYQGTLTFSVSGNTLSTVNEPLIEQYIYGVVLAEIGDAQNEVAYEVMLDCARSWTVWKVGNSDIVLTDGVKDQAYQGYKKSVPALQKALKETRGELVCGIEDCRSIEALHHSNSGGTTRNSEDYFNNKNTHLRSVNDIEWSGKGKSYSWEYKVENPQNWLDFCKTNHIPTSFSLINKNANSKDPASISPTSKVSPKQVRETYHLHSAVFDVQTTATGVVFKGFGYGHGVGLSQEGMMQMSKANKSKDEILHFYYKDVNIVKASW